MSRINVAELTQSPQNPQPQNGNHREYDEIDVNADPFQPMSSAQEEPTPKTEGNEQYLKGIYEQLQQANTGQTRQYQQTLEQLGQDPYVQQALLAKQQGKKLQLIDAQQDDLDSQLPKAPDETNIDWNALAQDPEKLSQHVVKTTTAGVARSVVPLIQGMIDKHVMNPMKQMQQQLQQVGGVLESFQRERITNEMTTVRNKNPELFDKLKPLMADLSGRYPNMPTNQLFNLAAAEAGVSITNAPQLATERPNQTTAVQPALSSNPRQEALLQSQNRSVHPNIAFQRTLEKALDARFGK